ncbi:MAG: MFS transporter [Oligoflexia bacterium]|nr:MFS transporter [Oligoflexia bacterium]
MEFFLYFLSFFFNFTYGVLLPIIPHLDTEHAGWAFTAFLLAKLVWFIPAGFISDYIGHKKGLLLALFAQSIALIFIAEFSSLPWLGRIFEGIALAQGTLSTFAFLRVIKKEAHSFQKSISHLLALGGLGMIFGPTIGYIALTWNANLILWILAISSALLFLFCFFLKELKKINQTQRSEKNIQGREFYCLVIGLTAAKAIGVGWEPNLAWWAQSSLHLSATLAGLSFLILGLSFVLGSIFANKIFIPIVFLGFMALELSLGGIKWLWWPAMFSFGLWYGIYITISVAKLGWSEPDRIGKHNAIWMLLTDVPMTFIPAILWNWREMHYQIPRASLGFILLFISMVFLFASQWRKKLI